MKKKLMAALLMGTMILGLTACGGSSESAEPKEKEYISEEQIPELFTSPEDFKGKYVKLTGQVFVEPEKDDDGVALQIWNDPKNVQNNFVVYYSGDNSIKSNDYVMVDGEISGEFSGENAFGGEVSAPLIKADTVEVKSYMEIMAPTTKEITPNASQEQHDLTITVDKIEYSDIETRLYLTVKNDGKETASYGMYDVKIVQDGKQIEQDQSSSSIYDGGYPELSYEVTAGASTSGILVFPVIDPDKDLKVIVPDAYSDNYEIEFKDFSFDIKAE